MRYRQAIRRSRHAPGLCYRKKDMQIAQLEPAADSISPLHAPPHVAKQLTSYRKIELCATADRISIEQSEPPPDRSSVAPKRRSSNVSSQTFCCADSPRCDDLPGRCG